MAFRQKKIAHFHPDSFRECDESGLVVSSIGYGTKGGYPDSLADYQMYNSLRYSVREGPINLIDTSYAFRLGRSERVIGKFLQNAISIGAINRQEIVITSKCGFAADDAIEKIKVQKQFLALNQVGLLKANDVAFDVYSLNPDWIRFQNAISRLRLGLNTIDIYYIHNPYENLGFFISPEKFELILAKAFEALEQLRQLNLIQYYGISSFSALRANPLLLKSDPMSRIYHLQKYLDIANKVGGQNHGLKFVEAPLSLSCPQAFTLKNQLNSDKEFDTLLSLCKAKKINFIGAMSLSNGRDFLKQKYVRNLGANGGTGAALQLTLSIPKSAIKSHLVGMNNIAHTKQNIQILRKRQLFPQQWEIIWREMQ